MFLVDDLLLAPFRGIYWIIREIQNATQQEYADEAKAVMDEMTELYMMLETERITEEEFAAREGVLLDQLDAIRASKAGAKDEGEGEE
jgi:hypothetical protein